MLNEQDRHQTSREPLPLWRMKLKRTRKLIEASEAFTCPMCMSENIILDETGDDFTWYECLSCGMSGIVENEQ